MRTYAPDFTERPRFSVARRPPGWFPPGPPTAGLDPSEIRSKPGEEYSFLVGDWRIIQLQRGHRWSVDDLVTAHYAQQFVADHSQHVDLGCGIGSVLLMHAWLNPAARGFGIEAQAISADMAVRATEWNGCNDRVRVLRADFRTVSPADLPYVPTVLTGTPPYFPPGTHTLSERPQCGPCRAEFRGSAADYVHVAEGLMGPASEFVVCDSFRYTGRVQRAAAEVGLHVHRTLNLIPRLGKDCLIQVFLLNRTPSAGWLDRLVVRGRDGTFTPQFNALRESMGMPVQGSCADSVYESEQM